MKQRIPTIDIFLNERQYESENTDREVRRALEELENLIYKLTKKYRFNDSQIIILIEDFIDDFKNQK